MSENFISDDQIKNYRELVFGDGKPGTMTIFDYFNSNSFLQIGVTEENPNPTPEPENSKMLMPENQAKINDYKKILDALYISGIESFKLCDLKVRRFNDRKQLYEKHCESIKSQKVQEPPSNSREIFLTKFVLEAMEIQAQNYINKFNQINNEIKNWSDQQLDNFLSKTKFDEKILERYISLGNIPMVEPDICKNTNITKVSYDITQNNKIDNTKNSDQRPVFFSDLLPAGLIRFAEKEYLKAERDWFKYEISRQNLSFIEINSEEENLKGKRDLSKYVQDFSLIELNTKLNDIKMYYALLEFAERKRLKIKDFLDSFDFENYNHDNDYEKLANVIGDSSVECFDWVFNAKIKNPERLFSFFPYENCRIYEFNPLRDMYHICKLYFEEDYKSINIFKMLENFRCKQEKIQNEIFEKRKRLQKRFLSSLDFKKLFSGHNCDLYSFCVENQISKETCGLYEWGIIYNFVRTKQIIDNKNLSSLEDSISAPEGFDNMFSLFDLYEGYFSDEINNLSDTDKKIFNDLKDDIKKIRDNEFKMAKLSKLKAILKAILYIIPAICTGFQYKDISEYVTHPFEKLKNDRSKDMHNEIVKQIDNISKTSKKNLEQK